MQARCGRFAGKNAHTLGKFFLQLNRHFILSTKENNAAARYFWGQVSGVVPYTNPSDILSSCDLLACDSEVSNQVV